jgi:hypothetical protein
VSQRHGNPQKARRTLSGLGDGHVSEDGGPLLGSMDGSFSTNWAVALDFQLLKQFGLAGVPERDVKRRNIQMHLVPIPVKCSNTGAAERTEITVATRWKSVQGAMHILNTR